MNSIKPINDLPAIEDFLHRPEVFRYAAEKGISKDCEFTSEDDPCDWLGFYVGGQLSGIINIHFINKESVMCHQYIAREHKEKYKECLQMFFAWMKENKSDTVKELTAYIPVIFERTIALAVSCGAVVGGIDPDSSEHRGELCDRVLLTINMKDI